jgi:hypothetical protein
MYVCLKEKDTAEALGTIRRVRNSVALRDPTYMDQGIARIWC